MQNVYKVEVINTCQGKGPLMYVKAVRATDGSDGRPKRPARAELEIEVSAYHRTLVDLSLEDTRELIGLLQRQLLWVNG